MAAASNIKDDGIPEIICFPPEPLTEENIVHELFHLKAPFLIIAFSFDKAIEVIIDLRVLQQLRTFLLDPILHQNFYPLMREMGYIPDRFLQQELEYMFSHEDLEGRLISEEWYRPFYYFAVALEINNVTSICKIEEFYENRKWHRELIEGQELVKIARGKQSTYNEIVDALLQALNFAYKGKAQFGIDQESNMQIGNTFIYGLRIDVKLI